LKALECESHHIPFQCGNCFCWLPWQLDWDSLVFTFPVMLSTSIQFREVPSHTVKMSVDIEIENFLHQKLHRFALSHEKTFTFSEEWCTHYSYNNTKTRTATWLHVSGSVVQVRVMNHAQYAACGVVHLIFQRNHLSKFTLA
jgi:hypothetical protein